MSSSPGQPEVISAGAVLVREREGRAEALVMQGKGARYELPKGHVERGETHEQAAVRELREETGLTTPVVIGARLGADDYVITVRGGRAHKTVHYFLARPERDGDVAFEPTEEATRALRWVTADELRGLPIVSERVRGLIAAALKASADDHWRPSADGV